MAAAAALLVTTGTPAEAVEAVPWSFTRTAFKIPALLAFLSTTVTFQVPAEFSPQ